MNNIHPVVPQTAPHWPEVNASTAKSNMSTPQVGAAEVPIKDSVIATPWLRRTRARHCLCRVVSSPLKYLARHHLHHHAHE